jgi:hypothetical protein
MVLLHRSAGSRKRHLHKIDRRAKWPSTRVSQAIATHLYPLLAACWGLCEVEPLAGVSSIRAHGIQVCGNARPLRAAATLPAKQGRQLDAMFAPMSPVGHQPDCSCLRLGGVLVVKSYGSIPRGWPRTAIFKELSGHQVSDFHH